MIHGVLELWTSDRDFSRFPRLTVINPLVGVGCCRAVVAIVKIVVSDLGASVLVSFVY